MLKRSDSCGCDYVPHPWEHVDMGDLGARIVRRSLPDLFAGIPLRIFSSGTCSGR